MNLYGYQMEGYRVNVINEREARAAAGLLFLAGSMAFYNSFFLMNFAVAYHFVLFFCIDFLIRIINPRYAPSLLLGRFFVRNQTPEYVGASQKRFAWSIGFLLSLPMLYLVVLDPQMTFTKVIICIICLTLLFSESAFSVCIGCVVYQWIKKDELQYCPGGACEVKSKDITQRFNGVQMGIVLALSILIVWGLLHLAFQQPNRSAAMKMFMMGGEFSYTPEMNHHEMGHDMNHNMSEGDEEDHSGHNNMHHHNHH